MSKAFAGTTPVEPEPSTPVASSPRRVRSWRWRGGLEAAFVSQGGPVHATNEDSCILTPADAAPVLCAVADGVGGGALGDVASQSLIAHCAAAPPEVYRDPKRLLEWLRRGDAVVRETLAARSDRPGASTLVAVWFVSTGRMHVVNVGDCRAYRLRPRFSGGYRIEQLTVDQTYGNLGLPLPAGGRENDPARMVGVGAVGTPPVLQETLGAGELLLLCSDGLHKFVKDSELARIVGNELRGHASLELVCRALVRTAQYQRSHDDVSALLVRRHRWFGAATGYWLALLAALLSTAPGLFQVRARLSNPRAIVS